MVLKEGESLDDVVEFWRLRCDICGRDFGARSAAAIRACPSCLELRPMVKRSVWRDPFTRDLIYLHDGQIWTMRPELQRLMLGEYRAGRRRRAIDRARSPAEVLFILARLDDPVSDARLIVVCVVAMRRMWTLRLRPAVPSENLTVPG